MNLVEIAKQLKDADENIILIYAFNATGKTRLCVEYKNITKNQGTEEHTGVYYNAFSEDLFVWDNDEENDNNNIRLNIIHSSLNQFHSFLSVELVKEKLGPYNPNYDFFFNLHRDPEKGIESITFVLKNNEGDKPIKISRGEERIFVWGFFLALFEVDAWSGEQDAHYFIDDPVSSLDEHNIFITADSIFNIVESNYLTKRIIVTTHHIGLFSMLFDRLRKGEKSSRYKNLTRPYILSKRQDELVLRHHDKEVFLFHLHLLQTLEHAVKNQLYLYHFVMLRQLLENISSFLGSGSVNYVLTQIGVANVEEAMNRVNSLSHQNAYRFQFNEMSTQEEMPFKEVFEKMLIKYNFILH
ncbi:MAG: AAA family ATPase [Bacteroidetes bacterium]|nr:AAA family ATPase [Bacteroidota bacterium]